jgi:hypothetical protein
MRIVLEWLDQLRRTTMDGLPSFCSAIVSQFEALAATCNTWAAVDHNPDGTHEVVRVGGTTTIPAASVERITLYWDGTDLKTVKPDGTVQTVTLV